MSKESSAAIAADEANGASRGLKGPSLPSGPRAGQPSMRKPPSLSTFALPTLSTRAPSESLLNSLAVLIARLPLEHRDVLRTVTELIKVTARQSRETKMPMSNLLLVFCPSLAMSPPLLRVLCEGEGIWNGPPKGVEDPVVVDIKRNEDEVVDIRPESPIEDACNEEEVPPEPSINTEMDEEAVKEEKKAKRESMGLGTLGSGPRPRGGTRRVPVPTLIMDDSYEVSSNHEAVESPPAVQPVKPESVPPSPDRVSLKETTFPVYPAHSPPPLTSSSDSLSTTSNSSGSEVPEVLDTEQASLKTAEPMQKPIVKIQSESPSSSPVSMRQTIFGTPVHFPSAASVPTTPISRSKLTLSYSSSSPDLGPATASPTRPTRTKKPSLQLLFHKHSMSSLLLRSQPSPAPSLPPSPHSTVSSVPPVLDMAIEHSPFSLGLTMDETSDEHSAVPVEDAASDVQKQSGTPTSPSPSDITLKTATGSSSSTSNGDFSRASSSSSAVAPTLFYTPVSRHRPLESMPSQTSFRSAVSTYSLFDLEDKSLDEEDDWARSVLMAADAGADSHGQAIATGN